MMHAPWYPGWNVVGVMISLQVGVIGTIIYAFAVMAVPISEALGVSRTALMLAPIFGQVGVALSSAGIGIILDRFSARQATVIGLLAFLVGLVGMALATQLWQLLMIFGTLFVLAKQLTGPLAGQIIAAKWFVRRRGAALSLVTMGSSIGGFVVPLLIGFLMRSMTYNDVLLLLAALWAALLLPAVLIGLQGPPTEALLREEAAGSMQPQSSALQAMVPVRALLANRNFLVATGAAMILVFVTMGVQYHMGGIAHDMEMDITGGAQLLASYAVASFLAKFGWAAVVDKFDSRIVFILAALLIALGICALMLANFRTMLLGSALIGLGTAAIMPLLAVMLAREFGSGSIGKVLGIAFTGVQISALAPVSVGLLRDIGGSYHLPLTVFAGLVGAGMLAILFYHSDAPPPARLPKGASAAVD